MAGMFHTRMFLTLTGAAIGAAFLAFPLYGQSGGFCSDLVNDPSVMVCDDFSGSSPLIAYTVTNPLWPGYSAYSISVVNGELVFAAPENGGLTPAAVTRTQAFDYKGTSIEATLRFDTANPFLRSGMGVQWEGPIPNADIIRFGYQFDEKVVVLNWGVGGIYYADKRIPWQNPTANENHHVRLEIEEISGTVRPKILAFKGYSDSVLVISETEETLGIDLSGLPAQLHPSFSAATYTGSPINQIFDNLVVRATIVPQYLYVTNSNDNNLSIFQIGSSGLLTPMAPPAPTESYPYSVAIDPAGRFLYVANAVSNTVSAYTILHGLLTQNGAPIAAGSHPVSVAIDPTGRFVYVANTLSNNVSAYRVGAAGGLTPIGTIAAGVGAESIAVDPTGRFVYVANNAGASVSAYAITIGGALTPLGAVGAGYGPISVAPDPTGRYVYVANYGSGSVSSYRVGATGALTFIGTRVLSGRPNSVAVDPTGRFVYIANSLGNTVESYQIGPDGSLIPPGALVAAGNGPSMAAADNTGKFVYVANFFSGDVSEYAIGPGARLTSLAPTAPSGQNASAVGINGGPAALSLNKVFSNFSDISRFQLNGSAQRSVSVLRLTEDAMGQAGSAFLKMPVLLRPDASFSASFAFQISGVNGSGDQGSDGLAFVIQHDPRGAGALGAGGGNLGFGTDAQTPGFITPSIAIEFDTHQNGFDPDGNHVALIVDGQVTAHAALATLPCPGQCLNSGSPIYVWVDYNGTTRRLTISLATQPVRPATPLISTVVTPLDQLSAHLDGRAYFGFTAGTGAGFNIHDVLNWAITVPGMAGDIDGDGTVGCGDVSALKLSLGKRSGQAGFNPLADTNGDGLVDVRDLAFVAQKIPAGTTCP